MARIYFALTRIPAKLATAATQALRKHGPFASGQMPTDQRNKKRSKSARHLLLVSGIAVLLWSGMEDSDALLVTLLGALLATAAWMTLLTSPRLGQILARGGRPRQAVLAGALIGALASVSTPLLMLFKDLRHAHVYPDYPVGMMLATLERMPAWALAGGLAGFGIGLLLKLGAGWRKSR